MIVDVKRESRLEPGTKATHIRESNIGSVETPIGGGQCEVLIDVEYDR